MRHLPDKIEAEIHEHGAIPFRRFMELALYCPVYGYYETDGDTPGRRGDYYTSVSVGSLFGEMLAWQFAEWLCLMRSAECQAPDAGSQNRRANAGSGHSRSAGATLQIVEAGAHRGELARNVLGWLRKYQPQIFNELEYWIVEPSERRREWQRRTLLEFVDHVRWASAVTELGPVRGVIFSNELLDAMPVHRMGWDAAARRWFEWGVTSRADRFVWTRLPCLDIPNNALPEVPPELGAVLPDGFTIEISLAARDWWRQAARSLERGKLLTFDYGFVDDEKLTPERTDGTLRAYRQHRVSADVLANPGGQDITAHIDFGEIQRSGEEAGLKTECFLTQTQFLTGIAAKIWKGDSGFGEWTSQQRRQFQTLIHPDHLGRAFRVLVQARAGERGRIQT